MYDYAFYGYLAYKAYEYSTYIFSVGKNVNYIYSWMQPVCKDEYSGWIFIDDKDSLL